MGFELTPDRHPSITSQTRFSTFLLYVLLIHVYVEVSIVHGELSLVFHNDIRLHDGQVTMCLQMPLTFQQVTLTCEGLAINM